MTIRNSIEAKDERPRHEIFQNPRVNSGDIKAGLFLRPREDAPSDWRERLCRARGVQFVCISGRGVVILVDDDKGRDGVENLCGSFCEIEEVGIAQR